MKRWRSYRTLATEHQALREAAYEAYRAIAFSYGGTHPDRLTEPEDKAMSAAMHRLHSLGFGQR